MSFELKPIQRIGVGTDMKRVAFTYPREEVPLLIRDRVSLDIWQESFDGVSDIYDNVFSQIKLWMILIPCCLPFTFCKIARLSAETNRRWLEFIKEQEDVYSNVGVHVTAAREIMGHGDTQGMETCGLLFTVSPNYPTDSNSNSIGGYTAPTTAAAMQSYFGSSAPQQQQSSTSGGTNVAESLEKLANLHRTGAINDSEYANAKAQLLSSNSTY